MVVRVGRYGPYVEELDTDPPRRATINDDLDPDQLTPAMAREFLDRSSDDGRVLGTDPETGREVVARDGRYGPYVTEILPETDEAPKRGKAKVKPRTASLFTGMDLATIDLDTALQLMSLPRVVGTITETTTHEDGTTSENAVEVTAQNGRYGPYLKKGTDSRSLTSEDQIFSITLDEAKEIYSQPKQRGRAAAKPPLAEFDADPVSGKKVVVRTGASGRMSPTVRPTRRCAVTTTSPR